MNKKIVKLIFLDKDGKIISMVYYDKEYDKINRKNKKAHKMELSLQLRKRKEK